MIDREKLVETLIASLVGSEWVPPGWRLAFIVTEIEDRGARSIDMGYCRLFVRMIETFDPIHGIPICLSLEHLLSEGRRLSDDCP